jgi:hypothetical protein
VCVGGGGLLSFVGGGVHPGRRSLCIPRAAAIVGTTCGAVNHQSQRHSLLPIALLCVRV